MKFIVPLLVVVLVVLMAGSLFSQPAQCEALGGDFICHGFRTFACQGYEFEGATMMGECHHR